MKIENEKNIHDESKSTLKKPYLSPKLSDFGSVTLLTQTNKKSPTADGLGNLMGTSGPYAS